MSITIQSEGRRHYLTGDTYPIKTAIRNAGCNWDRDRGAWWTGKREVAEGLIAGLQSGAVTANCSWIKLDTGFGVRVPAGVEADVGSTVPVQASSGSVKQVVLAALLETRADGSRVFAVPPRPASSSRGGVYDPQKFNGYGRRPGGYRKRCITDGNCSSFGSGKSCGGFDCDGY